MRYNIVKLRMLTESKHFVCMHVKPESDEPWDLMAIIYLVLNFIPICTNILYRNFRFLNCDSLYDIQ